jgi:hypothetical protein
MLAVDFFTVETVSLQRLYVFFSSSSPPAGASTSPAAPPIRVKRRRKVHQFQASKSAPRFWL